MTSTPKWQTAIEKSLEEFKTSIGKQLIFDGQSMHLLELHPPVIQIASVDQHTGAPHVRSLGFREFIHSPGSPQLPLILASTDIRTPKAAQFKAHPEVELAWWIQGTAEQYRISGKVTLIAAPGNEGATRTGGPAIAALNQDGFDWEEKRRQMFDSMFGYLKAGFCRPAPSGSKLVDVGGYEAAKKWPRKLDGKLEDVLGPGSKASEEERRNWELALTNFALVVIDPTVVDYLVLSPPSRRTSFTRRADGEWEEVAVVP